MQARTTTSEKKPNMIAQSTATHLQYIQDMMKRRKSVAKLPDIGTCVCAVSQCRTEVFSGRLRMAVSVPDQSRVEERIHFVDHSEADFVEEPTNRCCGRNAADLFVCPRWFAPHELARILTKVEDVGVWPDGSLDAYIAMISQD